MSNRIGSRRQVQQESNQRPVCSSSETTAPWRLAALMPWLRDGVRRARSRRERIKF